MDNADVGFSNIVWFLEILKKLLLLFFEGGNKLIQPWITFE